MRLFGVFAEPENRVRQSTLDFSEPTKNPKNKWGPRGILCTRGGKSKTKKQGEFLKYQ